MEDATQSALHATEDADHGRRPPGVAGVGVQEEQQLQHPVTSAASAASRVHHVTGLWELF